MLRALGILFDLAVASGWAWTTYLANQLLIDEPSRLRILLVITVLFILRAIYMAFPALATKGAVRDREAVITSYLGRFLSEYYRMVRRKRLAAGHPADPTVRVNVMLPTKRIRVLWPASLRIYYTYCPTGVLYTDEEKTLRWKKDEGTCGWAWNRKDVTIFDARKQALKIPSTRLSTKQRAVVDAVKSTLSIPIWHRDTVVGVLNLDSKATVGYTFLDNQDVVDLAVGCAIELGAHCPVDGVGG
jgi:hypothetical protein